MDPELVNSILLYVIKRSELKELDSREAERFLEQIAEKFVSDPSELFWWENLKGDHDRSNYEGKNVRDVFLQTVPDATAIVRLVVSAEDFRPWPIFEGPLVSILDLIMDQGYFEYAIADPSTYWIIFDTHHNDLLFAVKIGSASGGKGPAKRQLGLG